MRHPSETDADATSPPDWWTAVEAARALRCTDGNVHRLIAKGKLRATRPNGGKTLVWRLDVLQLLEEGRVRPEAGAATG